MGERREQYNVKNRMTTGQRNIKCKAIRDKGEGNKHRKRMKGNEK
jgi:hypothetical protein